MLFERYWYGIIIYSDYRYIAQYIKGRQIGDGAAFTGMKRQLGGSFGIATITTFMASRSAMHRANLSVNWIYTILMSCNESMAFNNHL